MLKRFCQLKNFNFLVLLVLIMMHELSAQTVIFSENMGVPSATTLVTAYTGFQNSGVLTFSNGAQAATADVRTTQASSGYTNSSGGGNVFFTGTSTTNAGGFSIEGINAVNFRDLKLDFAYRKESSTAFPNFAVDFWDGSAWVNLGNTSAALFNEAASTPVNWYPAKTITLPAAAQINGLKIRFVRNVGGTATIRVDDVILKGTPAVVGTCGTNVVVSSNLTSSCGPATVNLSVQSDPLVTGANWVWYSGSCGGTRLGTGASLTGVAVSATTNFFVRTEGGTCGSTRSCESLAVTVTPIPAMTIDVLGDTSLLPGQTTTLIATANPNSADLVYTWKKDGVVVSGATASSLVTGIDDIGTYTVSVSTSTGCTATSPGRRITAAASSSLWVSPNPSAGLFTVRFYSRATVFNFKRLLTIFSTKGDVVYRASVPVTAPYSAIEVDFSNMPKGLYFLQLRKDNQELLATGKVVVQ